MTDSLTVTQSILQQSSSAFLIQWLCIIMATLAGLYMVYWLIIEMPVLLKIKHKELYKKWGNV